MNKTKKLFHSIFALLCAVAMVIVMIPVSAVGAADKIEVREVGLSTETDLEEGYDYSYRLNAKDAFGGYYIFTNVENGGTTNGPAKLSLGNSGTELTVVDANERTVLSRNKVTAVIEDPGTYTYKVMGNLTDEEEVTTTYTASFSFTVGSGSAVSTATSNLLEVVEDQRLHFTGDTGSGGLECDVASYMELTSPNVLTVYTGNDIATLKYRGDYAIQDSPDIPRGSTLELEAGQSYHVALFYQTGSNRTASFTINVVKMAIAAYNVAELTPTKDTAALQIVETSGGYYLQFSGDKEANGGLFFTEKPVVSGKTVTVTTAKQQINVALKGTEYTIPNGLNSTLPVDESYKFSMDKASANKTCDITLKVTHQPAAATIESASDGTTYLALMKINGKALNNAPILSLNQNFAGNSFTNPLEIYVNDGEVVTVKLRSGSYEKNLEKGGSYKITKDGTYTIEFTVVVDGSTYLASKKFAVGGTVSSGGTTGGTTSSGSIADLAGKATIRDSLVQSTYGSIYKQTFRSGAEDDYFFSTVRNGGTSTTEVTLLFPDDWVITNSNGREFDTSRSTISTEGTYNLRVYAPQSDETYFYDDFSFTIKYSDTNTTGTSSSSGSTSGSSEESDEPQQIGLQEKEFKDFGLYEQKLDDSTYFYTNVANGDVIDGAVWLDIPQNIDFVLTRDGNEISYKSNQELYDRGNYFLLVWSANPISKKMQDFSEKRYGLFHFRIDRKIAPTPVTPSDSITDIGSLGFETLLPSTGETTGDGYISTLTPSGSEGSAWTELPGETPTGSDSMQEVVIGGETEGETEEEIPEENPDLIDAPVDRFAQSYLEEEERYLQENRAGAFYSSVPNGATINDSFVVDLIGEQGVTVTRNDQPYEFHTGQTIEEDGVYRFTFGTGDFSVSAAAYQVRILNAPVNNMRVFTPPEEWVISQVLFNGEKVASGKEWFKLDADGHYTFTLEDTDTMTQRNVSITLDRVAPLLNLAGVENGVAKGEVQVTALSEDLATVTMYLDGELINTKATLSDPGIYDLIAYDQAGNSTAYQFEIKYSMNTAAYLFIILLVALGAAVALFIVYNKRNAQVR